MRRMSVLGTTALGMIFAAVVVVGVAHAEVLEITGEFPAPNREASFMRSLSVDRFGGTEGPALGIAIERALTNSQFQLMGGRAGRDAAEGSISGAVSSGVEVRPFTRKEKRCTQKAQDGKCLTEADVEIPCTRRIIDLNADIRIVRNTDGAILYSAERPFHEEVTWCERGSPDRTVAVVLAGAIRGIAESIRGELVPRIDTYKVRVRESTKGLPKDVARRFKDLVIQTKRDASGACAGWNAMQADASGHPSLIFNLALCAEQRGDYESAVKLYTDAARVGANEGNEGADRAMRLIQGRADARERARRRG